MGNRKPIGKRFGKSLYLVSQGGGARVSDVETVLSDKGADRVIAYFNDALMSGELKIGDKLKSERDLSRELDVGQGRSRSDTV